MSTRKTTGKKSSAKSNVAKRGLAMFVQIEDVRLLESYARVVSFNFHAVPVVRASVATTAEPDRDAHELRVTAVATVTARADRARPSDQDLLRIEAKYLLVYSLPVFEGFTKEDFDEFGGNNAVFNLWPYWREFVQSMTLRMALPPLILPVFRLGDVVLSPAHPVAKMLNVSSRK